MWKEDYFSIYIQGIFIDRPTMTSIRDKCIILNISNYEMSSMLFIIIFFFYDTKGQRYLDICDRISMGYSKIRVNIFRGLNHE